MDTEESLRDLYCEFGRTAEMAQVMEVEAGNYALTYASLSVDPENISDDQREMFRSILDDVNQYTFGRLIKQVRKTAEIDQTIVDAIDHALKRRNHLTHHFFRSHNFAINSEEGRDVMRSELAEIYDACSKAHALFSAMTDGLSAIFERPKISEDQLQKLLEDGKSVGI